MLKSLEIVNKILMEATQYASGTDDEYKRFISFTTLTDDIETIKQDLEILQLIIKWKSNIYLKYDFEYLDKEESIKLKQELKLIGDYLSHHYGYIPKCFKKVGDNHD